MTTKESKLLANKKRPTRINNFYFVNFSYKCFFCWQYSMKDWRTIRNKRFWSKWTSPKKNQRINEYKRKQLEQIKFVTQNFHNFFRCCLKTYFSKKRETSDSILLRFLDSLFFVFAPFFKHKEVTLQSFCSTKYSKWERTTLFWWPCISAIFLFYFVHFYWFFSH